MVVDDNDAMGDETYQDRAGGIVGHIVVLDRQPNQIEKPTFYDVFGKPENGIGSLMDLGVRPQHTKRFRVLVKKKILFKLKATRKFILSVATPSLRESRLLRCVFEMMMSLMGHIRTPERML